MTDKEFSKMLTEAVSEALEINRDKLDHNKQRFQRKYGYGEISFHKKLYMPDFILDKVEQSYSKLKGRYRPTNHFINDINADEQHKINEEDAIRIANHLGSIRDYVVDVTTSFQPAEKDASGKVIKDKEYRILKYMLAVPYMNDLVAFIVLGGEIPRIISGYVNKKEKALIKKPNNWMFVTDKKDRRVKEEMVSDTLDKLRHKSDNTIENIVREAIKEAFSRKKKKTVVNDEGETVPEKCPKCGGKIGVYIQGEPIFKCSKCNECFGTLPFPKRTR